VLDNGNVSISKSHSPTFIFGHSDPTHPRLRLYRSRVLLLTDSSMLKDHTQTQQYKHFTWWTADTLNLQALLRHKMPYALTGDMSSTARTKSPYSLSDRTCALGLHVVAGFRLCKIRVQLRCDPGRVVSLEYEIHGAATRLRRHSC